jgi:hypothetical protein
MVVPALARDNQNHVQQNGTVRAHELKMKTLFSRLVLGLALWPAGMFSALAQPAGGAVTNAPAAQDTAAQSRAWLTFGLDRIEWLQVTWLGNPLWQYLASLLYLILAFYASRLVDFLFQTQFKKLAARTKTQLDDLLLDLAKGPVKIICFVVLLHVGLRVFAWPDWAATSAVARGTTSAKLTWSTVTSTPFAAPQAFAHGSNHLSYAGTK